jgi:hypothetical protein
MINKGHFGLFAAEQHVHRLFAAVIICELKGRKGINEISPLATEQQAL